MWTIISRDLPSFSCCPTLAKLGFIMIEQIVHVGEPITRTGLSFLMNFKAFSLTSAFDKSHDSPCLPTVVKSRPHPSANSRSLANLTALGGEYTSLTSLHLNDGNVYLFNSLRDSVLSQEFRWNAPSNVQLTMSFCLALS